VTELATTVITALLERTGLAGDQIDDVLLGQGYANGEAPASAAWPRWTPGCRSSVPGVQLDRRCGSGLQAVIDAAMMVQTGAADVVLAGGVESMSQAELLLRRSMRWGARSGGAMLEDRLARGRVTAGGVNHPVPGGMIETAENLRREYEIPREEQDELAAAQPPARRRRQERGIFDDEIVPVTVPQKNG
jgi:acetyl-CoA C-acetyltransferase